MKRFDRDYPMEKYRFVVDPENRTVTASSTYAGKTVTGKAKCAEGDTFDEQVGKELAAARCNATVAKLRMKRADNRAKEAVETLLIVIADYKKALIYQNDAKKSLKEANRRLRRNLDKLNKS